MNGYTEAFFPPAPSYPIVDRLTDGPAVVDLRQMAPLRLFAAQTHQQASRCPRSANGVRPFALPLAYAPCSLISRPPAASSSSSVPHGSRLNFSVPALGSDHAIPLSLPPDHGRRNPPSPCFSQGGSSTASPSLYRILRAAVLPLAPVSTVDFAPRPVPLHTQTSQTSLLPFKPIRLLCAPLAAPPDACRLRSALPLQFPATVSRSSLYSLPLVCASHAHHQTRGHVSFPQHSSATRYLSSALLTFPSPTPSPPSFAPRVHGSTFHLPLDLLPSTPPLASVRSDRQDRAPHSLIEHIRHTAAAASSFHLSQHRRPARHALPSASSPM